MGTFFGTTASGDRSDKDLPSTPKFLQYKIGIIKKTRPFRFLLLKSVVLDWFMVCSCLLSGLPNLGSQCKEPCENYKIQK